MSDNDITPDEYDEVIKASRPKYVPPRKLKHSEWSKIALGLAAVEESEADRGLPKGNHYLLQKLLFEILGVYADKETMKGIAQDVLDTDFTPD